MLENRGLSKLLPQLDKDSSRLRVKKLGSFAPCMGFVKSDLANFPSFLTLLPTTSLLSIPVAGKVPAG